MDSTVDKAVRTSTGPQFDPGHLQIHFVLTYEPDTKLVQIIRSCSTPDWITIYESDYFTPDIVTLTWKTLPTPPRYNYWLSPKIHVNDLIGIRGIAVAALAQELPSDRDYASAPRASQKYSWNIDRELFAQLANFPYFVRAKAAIVEL